VSVDILELAMGMRMGKFVTTAKVVQTWFCEIIHSLMLPMLSLIEGVVRVADSGGVVSGDWWS